MHTQPPVMTAQERDAHIQSCSDNFLAAYQRFEDFGNPCDRDEAYMWLNMQNAAIQERLLDEGVDFFQVAGARDGAKLIEERASHG